MQASQRSMKPKRQLLQTTVDRTTLTKFARRARDLRVKNATYLRLLIEQHLAGAPLKIEVGQR